MIGMLQRSRTWRSTRARVGELHGFGQLADVGDREVVAAGRRRDSLEQRAVLLHVIVLGHAVLAPHRELRQPKGLSPTVAVAAKRNMPGCAVS